MVRSQRVIACAVTLALVVSAAVTVALPDRADANATEILRAGASVGGAAGEDGPRSCSITLPGRSVPDGRPQLLTSGWCDDRSLQASEFGVVERSVAGTVGTVSDIGAVGAKAAGTALWEPDGIGLIDIASAQATTAPEVLTWGKGAGAPLASQPLKIRDVVAPKVGDSICKSSDITGWSCGKILGITDGYAGEGMVPFEQIVTDLCSTKGETGAPGMVGASAVGMLVGSSFAESCDPAAQDIAQPYTSFLSMRSSAGRPSALTTLAGRWEPQIAVEAPVINGSVQGAVTATTQLTGTLAFGGPNHTVSLTVPNQPPLTTTVRTDGTWQLSLAGLAPGRYDYSLVAGWGSTNRSTAVSGSVTVVATPRIAGADRWSGSVLASKEAFPSTAPVVYVASGETFPDALSASAAAAMEGGPLLLTPGAFLTDVTRAEIQRLRPSRIVVVGGEAVVSSAVTTQLATLAPVTRIAGGDRFETSRAVAARFPASTVAYLGSGLDFPDALSASAAAGARKAPVVLVDGRYPTVDQATIDRLKSLKTASVKLLGGTAAISSGIQSQLASSFTVARLAGVVREDTSRLVNDDYFVSAKSAYIATSMSFPDALSGGVLAARTGSPLYLVPGSCVPAATLQSLQARGVQTVTTLGGTAVVSESAQRLTSC